jgi:flagellar hook-associated protein 3 FlgL
MTTRVSDAAQSLLTQFQLMQTETQIANLQAQIGSGKVSQTFDGIAPDAQHLVSLVSQDTKVTQYVSNINLATQRLNATENAVTSIQSLATNFQTLLVNALNPSNASNMALNQSAQSQLNQLASLLNTQFEGQYLFAGSATSTVPVDLNAAGFTVPSTTYPSTADTNYYQGNTTQLAVQADDNFSVAYGVTADQPAFEELIRALHLAATASVVPGSVDTARLQEALRMTKLAIGDIANVQAQIGVSQNVLSDTTTTHTQFQSLLEQHISDIENVDVSKAATNLSSAQFTLQSSFAVISRLSQLSLVNFLK